MQYLYWHPHLEFMKPEIKELSARQIYDTPDVSRETCRTLTLNSLAGKAFGRLENGNFGGKRSRPRKPGMHG